MIKTQDLIKKIKTVIFDNHLTKDPATFCRVETIKSLKSMVSFYQENFHIEYMPTEINEVERCAVHYSVDHKAIKGLKKLANDIHSFLISN